MKSLEGTERGDDGFGSTGVHTMQQMNDKKTNEDIKHVNEEYSRQRMSGEAIRKSSQLSQSRQIITARQMSKIAKGDHPVFLAILRETNEAPIKKRGNKRSSSHAARFAAVHG